MTAVSSLMDRLLDLSNDSIQYLNSMCPSLIRKLKVIVYSCSFSCQNHRRLGTNCVSLCFTLFLAYLHNDPLCASYKALLRMSNQFVQCFYQLWYLPLIQKHHKADNSPPFSLVMKIHKIYIPRLKVASIEICVVSCFRRYESSPGTWNLIFITLKVHIYPLKAVTSVKSLSFRLF